MNDAARTPGSATDVGRRLPAPSALVSFGVLVADFGLVRSGHADDLVVRSAPPIVAVVIFLVLARGDLASLGLRLRPVQGAGYWVRATLLIGAAVGTVVASVSAAVLLAGYRPTLYRVPPGMLWPRFLQMCVAAPLLEESIYRVGLCPGAVPLLGTRGTILFGGLAFGVLHVLYGNPGPDNLVAGFFLAWAFLKGGSIAVPVALHSLGNVVALAAHLAAWYLVDA